MKLNVDPFFHCNEIHFAQVRGLLLEQIFRIHLKKLDRNIGSDLNVICVGCTAPFFFGASPHNSKAHDGLVL